MLRSISRKFHIVKAGQTLARIADYYSVSVYLIAKENGLSQEPFAGQVLKIPTEKGNAYTVQAGDTKELLCGSAEKFASKNGTDIFYIGMKVIL